MKVVSDKWLEAYKDSFYHKKVVIILGAGVSTASGIPDFRSSSGIFSHIQTRYKVKGERLFDYRFSLNPETRNIYLDFITQLKDLVDKSEPSLTHKFLNEYTNKCRKFRIYTQNVDLLEEKAGIKHSTDNKTDLVYLHGDLNTLKCLYCGYKMAFTQKENEILKQEQEIECDKCLERNKKRKEENKRSRPQGIMHPNIVHYNQPHPDGKHISKLNTLDSRCDLVLVIGTSLKIFGLKAMTKYFLNRCKENGGKSIYIDLVEPNKEFKNLFDYMYKGPCDEFFRKIADTEILDKIDKKELEDEVELNEIEVSDIIEDENISNKNICSIIEEKKIKDINIEDCSNIDSSMIDLKSALEEVEAENLAKNENDIEYEVNEEIEEKIEVKEKPKPKKKYVSRKLKGKKKK
ncbi:SIR2-like protein [Spraguea lophii 42_110]|uniref:SIR2-like protein n=1 Tax=Spraguea lophii (strain 42_110) TaxID=1358809 RepID=S7WAX0_SPRLO|nr:SIR2-like protein [Spraguea lophii 42_110]